MARTCTVCSHPERTGIDEALVAGESTGKISGRYRTIDERALRRHRANHLPAALTKAHEAEEVSRADDLLSQVRDLQGRALSILETAEATGELRVALGAIREARGNLELLARLLGELDDSSATVNVLISPAWLELRAVIVTALSTHPDAREAVLQAIGSGVR